MKCYEKMKLCSSIPVYLCKPVQVSNLNAEIDPEPIGSLSHKYRSSTGLGFLQMQISSLLSAVACVDEVSILLCAVTALLAGHVSFTFTGMGWFVSLLWLDNH